MSLNTYGDMNDTHIDVLTEVGNIGSGNAATALSAMIKKNVLIQMPTVKLMKFQEAIDNCGGAESLRVGILVRIKGDIEGIIMFLLEEEFAKIVINTFFGNKEVDLLRLDENDTSLLSEIGNIMASSYVSAIAKLANISINVEAPSLTVDMLGALMSVPVIEYGSIGDELVVIDKVLKIDDIRIKSNMMLIPTVDSLSYLFGKLGVDV